MTVLPVSFVHKHAQLGKCTLQAYYLDCPCCARPSGPVANRWTVQQQGIGQVLKSVERQFLLIWLNQRRQMQPIHNSCNLWILRWALTYITMTSKHNFWGFVLSLFLLLSSCVFLCVPVSPAATWFSSPPTPHHHHPGRSVEKPRLC